MDGAEQPKENRPATLDAGGINAIAPAAVRAPNSTSVCVLLAREPKIAHYRLLEDGLTAICTNVRYFDGSLKRDETFRNSVLQATQTFILDDFALRRTSNARDYALDLWNLAIESQKLQRRPRIIRVGEQDRDTELGILLGRYPVEETLPFRNPPPEQAWRHLPMRLLKCLEGNPSSNE